MQAILDERSVDGSGYFTVVEEKERNEHNSQRLANLIKSKPEFDFGRRGDVKDQSVVQGNVHIAELGRVSPSSRMRERGKEKDSKERRSQSHFSYQHDGTPSKVGAENGSDGTVVWFGKGNRWFDFFSRQYKSHCKKYAQVSAHVSNSIFYVCIV